MARPSDPSTYTDPDLRDRLKAEITAGDRGGRPGQWSARKAQLLAHEYRAAGGSYRTDKADEPEPARHLDTWTDEDWRTRGGGTRARDGDETARYLPAEAWEGLSSAEAAATDRRKRRASRRGEQHVANTPAAADAGRRARDHGEEPLPSYDDLTVPQVRERIDGLDAPTARRVLAYERDHRARRTLLPALQRAARRS